METLDLDLIIVPGMGFTSKGERLGHGMGHYDRWFEKYRTKLREKKHGEKNIKLPFTIGVGLSCQLLDFVPTDEHDYNLDLIITP